MCQICESMLAAEHAEQPGTELCPKCRRFPLDAEAPFDPSQWDYVAPELRNPGENIPPRMQEFDDGVLLKALESSEGATPGEADAGEEPDDHVRTCYHCYQIASGLGERCPVCGDSYLPPAMRKPYHA